MLLLVIAMWITDPNGVPIALALRFAFSTWWKKGGIITVELNAEVLLSIFL
jgi:hypothetical protein